MILEINIKLCYNIFHTMNITSQLESILFVASKPLLIKRFIKVFKKERKEIEESLEVLVQKYNCEGSGIKILKNGDEYQMVSSPDNVDITEKFVKAEITGELTRPQLETLTVVSYRGPITKPELEQIRGVNCSLIIRNLMMRGLVQESSNKTKLLPSFEITIDYLRLLGLNSVEDLPDYETLHKHEYIEKALDDAKE